jgi:hypothetical protein
VWFYYEKGFSIFPVRQTTPPSLDNKKPAIPSWKEYMERRPSKEEIQKWLDDGLFGNIALVCGKVSGNIVILDLDDDKIIEDLKDKIDLDKLMDEKGTWVQATGKPGRYHLICKNKDDPGGTIKENSVHLEYRANGAYCVVCPSIHPNGNVYHFLNYEPPEKLPELKKQDVRAIFEDMVQLLYKRRGIKRAVAKPASKEGAEAPCISKLLEGGLKEGGRNDSAFCLALWYKNVKKMNPEEIKTLLANWNKKNTPPLPPSELSSLVDSALKSEKSTGCKRIGELGFCIFEKKEECSFYRPKRKKGKKEDETPVMEVTMLNNGGTLYEQVYDMETFETKFVYLDEGHVDYIDAVEYQGIKYIPVNDRKAIEMGAVYFPEYPEEYGTLRDLIDEINQFVYKYMDVSDLFRLFATWYILFSWVTDYVHTVPYLRVIADFASGKSRFLHTVGRLCYKPMIIAGATTTASLFRSIERWRGTLVLEEYTPKDSGEVEDEIKVLNCGFERGTPVVRCHKETNKLEYFDAFGPKVISSRQPFKDQALNSRCLTEILTETDREDIPILLPPEFFIKQKELRNKLLMFRLNHWKDIDPDAMGRIQFRKGISKRLRQAFSSFIVLFSHDEEALENFMEYVEQYNKELIEERAQSFDGMIINSFLELKREGCSFVTSKMISEKLGERGVTTKSGNNISSAVIGRHLKTMGLTTKLRKLEGTAHRSITEDPKILKVLKEKYVVDDDEDDVGQEQLFGDENEPLFGK